MKSTLSSESSLKVDSFSMIEEKAAFDLKFRSCKTAGSTKTLIRFSCLRRQRQQLVSSSQSIERVERAQLLTQMSHRMRSRKGGITEMS